MSNIAFFNMYVIRSTVLVTSIALIASGCATTRTANGVTEVDGGCNPAAMALFGAVLGALVSGKNNRNQGAVVGAAIGGLGCLAWNYRTVQTKTAAQVNQDYKVANSGSLPSSPTVVGYSVAPEPSNTLASGNPMVIRSKITVVDGATQAKPPEVEEQLVVMHDGKVISQAKKRANEGQGSGEYATQFTVKLPSGVPQGDYPVKTALFLDGRQVESRSLSIQVVKLDTGEMVALLQQ